jgi:proteasome lid subunit RPN8/RPN11
VTVDSDSDRDRPEGDLDAGNGLTLTGMSIDSAMLAEVVSHAHADAPDECCGIIASVAGTATRVFREENIHHTPLRFEIAGPRVFRVLEEIEEAGWELGAIYHSHTRSAPRPSQTDINMARQWPGTIWVIVGLADGEPEVRAWRIVDDDVHEVTLAVT